MIKDAVIHLLNEQPLVADLPAPPAPGDLLLICTNLRTMNRKRPVFVDHVGSLFAIPYAQVRFVEMPHGATALPDGLPMEAASGPEADEADVGEELLRRVREL